NCGRCSPCSRKPPRPSPAAGAAPASQPAKLLVITTNRTPNDQGVTMTEATTLPQPTTDNASSTAVGIAPTGHRLPAITSLGRVRLQIADLERSRAWYESVLGLRAVD